MTAVGTGLELHEARDGAMPPDHLEVDLFALSDVLQQLQQEAKEKTRAYFALVNNTVGHEAGNEHAANEARTQALLLLHRSAELGQEIRDHCIHNGNLSEASDDFGIKPTNARVSISSGMLLKQPPLVVVQMLMLTRGTHVMLRELFASGCKASDTNSMNDASRQDILSAIEHAKEAYKIARSLASIAKRERAEADADGTACETQRHDAAASQLAAIEEKFDALHFAKNEMRIAVLWGFLGRHDKAIKRHRAAVQILSSLNSVSSNSMGNAPRVASANELLPIALYNLGSQLKQLASMEKDGIKQRELREEMQAVFDRAFTLGEMYLKPNHPLLQQLQQAKQETSQPHAIEIPAARLSVVSDIRSRKMSAFPTQNFVIGLPHLVPLHSQNYHQQMPSQNLLPSNGFTSHAPNNFPFKRQSVNSSRKNSLWGIRNSITNVAPQMQSDSFVKNRRQSKPPPWDAVRSATKKKKDRPTAAILFSHRLRHPSDALRLGGICVVDPLFAPKEDPELKAEKERLKKMRRRKLRERSFLPEEWKAEEDSPLNQKKKKKKERNVLDTDGSDEKRSSNVDEVHSVSAFEFPHKKKKKRKSKDGMWSSSDGSNHYLPSRARTSYESAKPQTEHATDILSHGNTAALTGLIQSGVPPPILEQRELRGCGGRHVLDPLNQVVHGPACVPEELGMSIAKQVRGGPDTTKVGHPLDSEEEEEEDDECTDEEDPLDEEEETILEAKERCETELMNYFSVMYARRVKLACRIQCAWRRSRARIELKKRQQILYRSVYQMQKAAAMCIEGFFCSIIEQRRLRQKVEQCMVAVETRMEYENQLIRSASVISRYVKRFLSRRGREKELCRLLALRGIDELRLHEVGATIVARWWRVISVQKAYWRKRTLEVRQRQKRESFQQLQCHAATVIQRHFRGLLGRREAVMTRLRRVEERRCLQRRLQESTDLVRLCLQEHMRRCRCLVQETEMRLQQREAAAVVIQARWREALKRQMIHNVLMRCRRIVRAVLTIQRVYRRFCAGREIRYLRKVHHVMNQDRLEREYRVFRATLTLQCFGRVVVAKRRARHRRAAIGRGFFFAAIAIQAACRGGTIRIRLGYAMHMRQKAAMLLMQLLKKKREQTVTIVSAFLRGRESSFIAESNRCRRLTEKLYLRRLVRRDLFRDKSATILQRAVRRWIARRRQHEAENRKRAMRALVLACVVRIQAVMRGALARRLYRLRQYLSQQRQQKREDMEEVMVQLCIDEWRAAMLQCEHDRRRIETLEARNRETLECRYKWRESTAAKNNNNADYDYTTDQDELERSLSTYRDGP